MAGDIGPGPDQEQGDVGEAVVERSVQGRVAQTGHSVHICPRPQQAAHRLALVMVVTWADRIFNPVLTASG